MKIHALTTGTVRIRQSQRRGVGHGLRRRARIFAPGPLTGELPIHAWAIEHEDGIVLVDTGEVATARDQPFARFSVRREDELDRALRGVGLDPGDVVTVVLTHVHVDHVDGLAHVAGGRTRVLASAAELRWVASAEARLARAVLRQGLPAGFAPTPLQLAGPRLGAFATSEAITHGGRIVAVPAPGHTPGHLAVVVVRDGDHVLLAGDSVYDQDALLAREVDGISPREDVALATIDTIRAHVRLQPTVVLPTHDPGSAARLAASEPLPA